MQPLVTVGFHGRVAFMTLVPKTLKGLRPLTYEPNPTTLGEHLKKRRVELGLFQKEAAAQIGVCEMSVLDWENDRTTPTVSLWPKVITFLGYDPHPEPQTLGEQIASRRRTLGLDQRQAAKIIGVDYTTLMRYERGEWKARGDRLVRIVQFCRDGGSKGL